MESIPIDLLFYFVFSIVANPFGNFHSILREIKKSRINAAHFSHYLSNSYVNLNKIAIAALLMSIESALKIIKYHCQGPYTNSTEKNVNKWRASWSFQLSFFCHMSHILVATHSNGILCAQQL